MINAALPTWSASTRPLSWAKRSESSAKRSEYRYTGGVGNINFLFLLKQIYIYIYIYIYRVFIVFKLQFLLTFLFNRPVLNCVHPVSITRFPSFRTQTLESLRRRGPSPYCYHVCNNLCYIYIYIYCYIIVILLSLLLLIVSY